MKKIILFSSVFIILFALTACNAEEAAPPHRTESLATTQTPPPSGGQTESNVPTVPEPPTAPQPPRGLQPEPEEMFTYVFDSELQGIRLTKYHGELTQVKLPDEIAGHPIVAINGSTFIVGHVTDVFFPDALVEFTWGGGNLADDPPHHLVVPYGVTRLGRFGNHNAAATIRQITLPSTLRYIHPLAFSRYSNGHGVAFTSLTRLSLPYGMEEINVEIFGSLSHIVTIDVPDTISRIRWSGGATQARGLSYLRQTGWYSAQPDGVVYFGRIAIDWKGDMPPNTTVTIADGTVNIADSAFSRTGLSGINIPDSVTRIEDGAFAGNQLTSVTIPNNVMEIGRDAFANNQLTSVTIPDDVAFVVATAQIEEAPRAEPVEPARVASFIERWAFSNNPLDEATHARFVEIHGY
ncbi:MAG: leucine-rich repeat domain-containing protein [Defluviitaleaceae bacterium]|nr:leucine-rich repeat domain-containing protein [Defluviitaleaceae bacterium]